jgi:hypothetical protein
MRIAPLIAGAIGLAAAAPVSAASVAAAPVAAAPVAAAPAESVPVVATPVGSQVLAVGAGAVMGVVAFNILSAPFGIVPLAGGALEVVPGSVALGSRLIAVTTAGSGAIGANWLYDRWTGQQSNYRYLLTLGAGALAGVAIGNYLVAGTVGAFPYVGSGVAEVADAWAPAAQAASRIYAVGSAVLGAWAADWFYRH